MTKKVTCAERIREGLELRGMIQKDLCELTGIPKSAMSQYCSGSFVPKQERTYKIAKALNVSEAWLMGFDVPMQRQPDTDEATSIPLGFQPLPDTTVVPIIGRIACGEPITAEENVEGLTSLPSDWHADFILICEGDSMEPTIKAGDAVAIRKTEEVQDGQIAAVRIGDEATLKRIYWDGVTLSLIAENSKYAPRFLTGEQLMDVHIEGQAVGLCRGL